MLDPESDVLADPRAADLSLPDRISDPACGHIEVRRSLVDGHERLLLRRLARLTRRELARPHTPLKDTAIARGGLDVLAFRGYASCGGVMS
jgi:hypothetical protein